MYKIMEQEKKTVITGNTVLKFAGILSGIGAIAFIISLSISDAEVTKTNKLIVMLSTAVSMFCLTLSGSIGKFWKSIFK
jgi:hypothetical protein